MRLPGRTWRCLQRLVLLASVLGTTSVWADESNNKLTFNLPSDEFPTAILEFYRQSKIEVLFLSKDSLNAIHTHPVVGEFTPREALDIMLRDTGLIYNFATEHSVSIKQLPPPELPPAPKKPERKLVSAPPLVHGELEMVTVTGSLIRGVADVRAPIVDVTQRDLSFAPFPTVQDALYQLPIVSLDAPREDLGINNNFNWGSAINLRGLGVGATLVLVNGRRQPLSGLNSDFVDVSNIPAAAVDRIEILPQGASAIYGSDAVAGVVNIILKDHFDGAQTEVHYGGTAGGRDNIVVSQLLGTHWGSGNVMFVYQYSDGAELTASARGYAANENKTPYGGGDYRSFYADPGNILDPNTLLPVSGGTGGAVKYENSLANFDLFPQATQHSFYGTGKEELGPVELFAEGRFTQRSTYEKFYPQTATVGLGPDNPFNPSPGTTTLVDYSFSKVFGPSIFADETQNYVGTLGARVQFGKDWEATLSETYGQERLYSNEYNTANGVALDAASASADPAKAFNPFGTTNSDVLASIWENYPTHATSGIENTSLIADGTLLDIWSGPLKVAAGLERREENLSHSEGVSGVSGEVVIDGRYDRHVGSAFTELSVPLIGDPSNPHAVPRLELTLAGRYDHYSDFGGTTNPEFGIRWVPMGSLKFRGSWGRSYRAPKLDDLYDSSNNASGLALLPDPQSPTGGRSLVLAVQGDNPKLKPEVAKSWTTGFDVVPDFDPELAFSLTYYSIKYTGQVAAPDAADPSTILTQADEWAAVITRNPTAAQIAAICNRSDYLGSVATCLASTPAAIVDLEVANLASTQTNGLDLSVHQKLITDAGYFNIGFTGNYVFHFDQEVSNTSPSVDILNTYENPLKFRFRTTAVWDRHLPEESGFGASLALNFTNAYKNPGSTLLPDIGSWTTLDLQLRYHTAENSGWLGGMDIALNAVNVFNQSPPFADSSFGYDRANAQPLGRVLGLSVTKKW
jgi:iron complex outermembrane recepter protein